MSDLKGGWRAEGCVTNVANKRAVRYIDTTGYDATPPRTIGLRLSYDWRIQ